MGKTNKQILMEARELISRPKRWGQGYYAQNTSGEMVGPLDEDAVCFCGHGALLKVLNESPLSAGNEFYQCAGILKKFTPTTERSSYFPYFNDAIETTHEEVLAVFDKAIASL